jgi:hypothetical protein
MNTYLKRVVCFLLCISVLSLPLLFTSKGQTPRTGRIGAGNVTSITGVTSDGDTVHIDIPAIFADDIWADGMTTDTIKFICGVDTVKMYHDGTDFIFEGDAGTGSFKFNKGLDVTGGVTASGAGTLGSLVVGAGSDSVGYTGGTLDVYKTAAGPLLRLTSSTEDSIFIVRDDRRIIGGLTVLTVKATVANDGTIALDSDVSGWGNVMVGDNEEYAEIRFSADGTVTLLVSSADVASTDTGSKFCIFDNGDHVLLKNRLGSSKTVAYNIYFYEP